MKDRVAVVTITERDEANAYDFKVKVFHALHEAEKWIDSQIESLVKKHHLDPLKDVDSWFVLLNGWNHTIQFNLEEMPVV